MRVLHVILLVVGLSVGVVTPASGQAVFETGEFSLVFDGFDVWFDVPIDPVPDGADWAQFLIDAGLDSLMSNGQLLSDAFLTTFDGYNCCLFRMTFSGMMGSNPSLDPLEIDDAALMAEFNAKLGALAEFRFELIETPASGPENIPVTGSLESFSFVVGDSGSGLATVFIWDWDGDDSFIEGDSTYRFRLTAVGCAHGTTNAGNGFLTDVLYLNGSNGGEDRTVEGTHGDFLTVTVLEPIAGGSGRFVVHANASDLSAASSVNLPFEIGAPCFPFLLSQGGAPVIVANGIGRPAQLGESNYFGAPVGDPDPAMTQLFYPALPLGTVLTFQGVIVDPASTGTKAVSTTNAVTLRVQ